MKLFSISLLSRYLLFFGKILFPLFFISFSHSTNIFFFFFLKFFSLADTQQITSLSVSAFITKLSSLCVKPSSRPSLRLIRVSPFSFLLQVALNHSPLRSLTSPFRMFLLSPFSFLLHFTSSFQLFLFSPSFSTSPRLPPFLFAHWVLQPRSEGERFDCSHLRLSPLLFCLWYDIHQISVAFLNLVLPIFYLSGQL